MIPRDTVVRLSRNLGIYGIGLVVAIIGALMLVEIWSGPWFVAGILFFVGLGIVVFVHERLDGPI